MSTILILAACTVAAVLLGYWLGRRSVRPSVVVLYGLRDGDGWLDTTPPTQPRAQA